MVNIQRPWGEGDGSDHKDLEAWKRAMDLVVRVYHLTKGFPQDEKFGLTSQMRRAAVSVPSNLSEGAARPSDRDFAHFLGICMGSLSELETQSMLSERLGYLESEDILPDLRHVRALVAGLRK